MPGEHLEAFTIAEWSPPRAAVGAARVEELLGVGRAGEGEAHGAGAGEGELEILQVQLDARARLEVPRDHALAVDLEDAGGGEAAEQRLAHLGGAAPRTVPSRAPVTWSGARPNRAGRARPVTPPLGLDSQGPPDARAQAPLELFDPGPDYDVANLAHGD